MPTYAAASDVAVRWGRTLTSEETALITERIKDVERRILRRVPDLAAKITAGDVDELDVIQIEADAVLRLVRNPEGYIQETDGDYSYMLSREAASGKLTIDDEDWALLGGVQTMMTLIPTFTMPS